MEDEVIVDLFWERNDNALKMLEDKYGKDFYRMSYQILNNKEDSEECVNDAYLKTWNSIPDARPTSLFAYVGKIVRRLSINRIKMNSAQKRGGDETALLLSELNECISANESVESEIEYQELSKNISEFLFELKQEQRMIFVERYWYAKPVKEIANKYKISIKKTESILFRCRKGLHEFLKERRYFV